MDVVLIILKWAVKCVISSLCGVSKSCVFGGKRCFCTVVESSC